MTEYKHVMVAVDQSDDAAAVAHRALAVARRFGAKLTLMHVVDQRALTAGGEADIPMFGMRDKISIDEIGKELTEPQPVPFSTDDRLIVQSQSFLEAIAAELGEPDIGTHVAASSSIPRQIIRVATELKVDLLACGAHHRHGLALFLPSPVDGIIHHLPCDVLLLRLA